MTLGVWLPVPLLVLPFLYTFSSDSILIVVGKLHLHTYVRIKPECAQLVLPGIEVCDSPAYTDHHLLVDSKVVEELSMLHHSTLVLNGRPLMNVLCFKISWDHF